MGYRCENRPGAMCEQFELAHIFSCGLEKVSKVLETGLEKVWNSDASKE